MPLASRSRAHQDPTSVGRSPTKIRSAPALSRGPWSPRTRRPFVQREQQGRETWVLHRARHLRSICQLLAADGARALLSDAAQVHGAYGREVERNNQHLLLTTAKTGEDCERVNDPIELARRLAPVMKALSDENRLAILLAVAQQDRSVTELTTATGLAQTLVSHHLKSLRDNGLVTVTAHGRSNVYSLCCAAVADPLETLAALAKDPSHSLTTGA